MHRRCSFLTVAALLLVVGIPASTTLARYTRAASTTGSVVTGTLAPPTGLGATGGATVTLTWTPSAYVAAHIPPRPAMASTATSGSGYALVKNVTPETAATTTDSPGAGTWYYVLRTTFQGWSSINSNHVRAIGL